MKDNRKRRVKEDKERLSVITTDRIFVDVLDIKAISSISKLQIPQS